MANATLVIFLLFVLLLLHSEASLSSPPSTECRHWVGPCLSPKTTTDYGRKVLKRDHQEELLQQQPGRRQPGHAAGSTIRGSEAVVNQLRKVPAGPDPMHHNGGGPKNPIIIP